MRLLVGPEAFWLLCYLAATLVVGNKTVHSKTIEQFIQTCWFSVPLLVLLTFALWWVPVVEKDWLLMRVWVAGLLGGHFTLLKIINASAVQNSGTGMGYLAGMIFLIVFLIAGSIIVAFKVYLSAS